MVRREPSFNEKLVQEPISEDEIDELRRTGQGFNRDRAVPASREPIEAHHRHSGYRVPSAENKPSILDPNEG